MLEKQIEAKVCDYAKQKGMLCYKFSSPNHAAVPDRMFISRGFIFFVEFKAEGKTPTVPQVREHARMTQHGAAVYVIDSVNDGKYLIDLISSNASSAPAARLSTSRG